MKKRHTWIVQLGGQRLVVVVGGHGGVCSLRTAREAHRSLDGGARLGGASTKLRRVKKSVKETGIGRRTCFDGAQRRVLLQSKGRN